MGCGGSKADEPVQTQAAAQKYVAAPEKPAPAPAPVPPAPAPAPVPIPPGNAGSQLDNVSAGNTLDKVS